MDLADVLLKHQKWISLLPRVEPFYGWYLGKQRVKKVLSGSPGLVDFAIWVVNSVFNLPDRQVIFF